MKNQTQIDPKKSVLSFLFGILLLIQTLTLSAQINKYGMSLSGTDGNYTLKDASKICPLIVGGCNALPPNAYSLYAGYQPNLISDNDFAYCTTLKYTFKTYSSYSLSLEVDIPKLTAGPHPFIIWVHGGGWANGGTTAFANQSQYLASRGIAGVRLTYSLISQGGNFDLGMRELADAYAFVQQHATEWGLDMTRFGYAGGSAGTPLSSLAAMKHNANGNDCKLYMGCNGIYDFQKNLAGAFGSGASPYLTAYPTKESRNVISSINYIPSNPTNIPAVALFHGTADFTISYLQSVALYDSIISKGGRAEKNIYDYYVHAFFNKGSSDMYEDMILKMYAFAKSVFGTPTVTIPPPSQSVIARFLFTTGENQTKPTKVAKGVTISDFQIGNVINSNYIDNALETQGWGGLNISGSKYVGFEIKSNPDCSFKVNNIDLKMKKSTSTLVLNGIFNYGTKFPPTTTRGFQKFGIATTDYSTVSLLPNSTPLAQTNANLCFGIGISTGTSTTEVISFDEITVYGEVVKPIITVPTILADTDSISFNTYNGTPQTQKVTVFGEMLQNTVQVSVEGDLNGYFSVDQQIATVTELQYGKTIQVNFSPQNTGVYTAELKLQSEEASLILPLSATSQGITAIPAISITAIPTGTQVGTNIVVDYKYTLDAPGRVRFNITKNGGATPSTFISTVANAVVNPAAAGTDVTGTFSLLIPANTIPTSSLIGNENYRVKIELYKADNTFIIGDYSNINYNFIESTLDNANPDLIEALSLYPNPIDDVLNVKSVGDLTHVTYEIIDISGKVVLQSQLVNKSIDVSKLNSGIYILSLNSEDGDNNIKFIKK